METLSRYRDLVLPVGIIACLAVILVPLPPALMDLLLAANIAIGVIVLLTTINIATPLEFSVFPSLLLATTLSRLVLNIATTRLILTSAETDGLNAAGGVIRSFGEFVAGDRIEVGLIIFVILVLIQFVVITKGSSRISEVAARFALDGMPGRQMAIDADVNAGLIDEVEAHRRRDEIRAQADFYGAMDGASKFVRGDAIAGLVITVINIVGGLYIGVISAGMPLGEASSVFTKLTIGDGLVSQIPALLISLAAGLLVTRSASRSSLPTEFLQQLLGNTKALAIAGVFLLLLIGTNLPAIPLAILGLGCIGLAIMLQKQVNEANAESQAKEDALQAERNAPKPKQAEDYLQIDPLEVSIGMGLLSIADPAQGGDLMQRIGDIRNRIATEIGIVLPKVRVRDEASLDENSFAIRLAGNTILTSQILPNKLLAVDNGQTTGQIDGLPATQLASEQRSYWIDADQIEQAEIYGYVVRKPAAVLAEQLHETCTFHASEILTRDATKQLIDRLRETSPTVVDELIPDVMRLKDVQQVLQSLLHEGIPIRQLGSILEHMGDGATQDSNITAITARVRRGLARTICTRFRDASGVMHVVTIDPALENVLGKLSSDNNFDDLRSITPEAKELACKRIKEAVKNLIHEGHPPIVLVAPQTRTALRQITAATIPWLRVLSFDEITTDTQINSHELIAGTLDGLHQPTAA